MTHPTTASVLISLGERRPLYVAHGLEDHEIAIVEEALQVLGRHMAPGKRLLDSSEVARDFVTLLLAPLDREMFGVLWLDAGNRVITHELAATGSTRQLVVYIRNIVKRGLEVNACAAIVFHNHPSGVCEPSDTDKRLTTALDQALALVDIKLLDHILVAGAGCMSFAQRGLL